MLFMRHFNNMDVCFKVLNTPKLFKRKDRDTKEYMLILVPWIMGSSKSFQLNEIGAGQIFYMSKAKIFQWQMVHADPKVVWLRHADWKPAKDVVCE